MKRSELVQKCVRLMVGDDRFRLLRGHTLEQLNDVVNMVLDARNEVAKEMKRTNE